MSSIILSSSPLHSALFLINYSQGHTHIYKHSRGYNLCCSALSKCCFLMSVAPGFTVHVNMFCHCACGCFKGDYKPEGAWVHLGFMYVKSNVESTLSLVLSPSYWLLSVMPTWMEVIFLTQHVSLPCLSRFTNCFQRWVLHMMKKYIGTR